MGDAIGQELKCAGHTLKPGTSIGVARIEDGVTVDHLLKIADIALYEVKASGRGHCRMFADRRSTRRFREASKRAAFRRNRISA